MKKMNRAAIKEAIDNLPGGVCFFDYRDFLVLCSRQMYRLVFAMANLELQSRAGLDAILESPPQESEVVKDQDNYLFPDGTVWTFQKRVITDDRGRNYTEYVAFDVSELYQKKKVLESGNAARQEVMKRLEVIARNVVSITREEEILAMKMQIHNSLSYILQTSKQYFKQPEEHRDKKAFIAEHRKMARRLLGEVGMSDEVDVYEELERIAQKLGIDLETRGLLPQNEELRNLLAMAVRECMVNTIRHAKGKKVTVTLTPIQEGIQAEITNDGRQPASQIQESGGLASLRTKIERAGGSMEIISTPQFILKALLPCKV